MTRYYSFKSSTSGQHDSLADCFDGFDLWEYIGGQLKQETVKIKECPIYEELCLIFEEPDAEGKFVQSSHYGELKKSAAAIGSFVCSRKPKYITYDPIPFDILPWLIAKVHD
ncbi:unnamed protein product [Cuscuta europaea]|uniref:Uncharacterized protein n=1 Tax=Cuscuta europaea TaxID=41803 RepID=A0A9P0YIN9_CUSEU|nr:unnamed protein product [Cuscuta europaea]